jgi:hypothetical protein
MWQTKSFVFVCGRGKERQESISIALMNGAGKIVMESVIETKVSMILQLIKGCAETGRSHLQKEPRPPGGTTCENRR